MALAGQHRDIQMKLALERDVRLVRFEQGQIEFSLSSGASPQLAQTLARRLQEWTGTRWMVAVSNAPGAPSLKEQEDARDSRSSCRVCAPSLWCKACSPRSRVPKSSRSAPLGRCWKKIQRLRRVPGQMMK